MQKYKEQLLKNGYCVIPNIITPDTVAQLRHKYLAQLSDQKRMLTAQDVLNNSDLSSILFSPKVINTLSAIIGDGYCLYPDFTLRSSVYVPWHTDVPYLLQAEDISSNVANMLQVSLYLQDNSEETGGGLDAIAGSHHYQDINHQKLDLTNIDLSQKVQIPSLAGSLTLWDSRLIHKSSEPKVHNHFSEAKLALQWTISRNDKLSVHYLKFLLDRMQSKLKDPIYDKTDREQAHLLSMSKLKYPESFSSDQLVVIEQYGIKLQLLNKIL